MSATLVDCGPTSPTPCRLLQKQSLVSSAQPNEINDTIVRPHTVATRAIVEDYREKRREKSVRKSRCTDVGMTLENFIKLELFYLTEGYKTEASSCKDVLGNLVTDPQGILRLCRKYFFTLLQDYDNTTWQPPLEMLSQTSDRWWRRGDFAT